MEKVTTPNFDPRYVASSSQKNKFQLDQKKKTKVQIPTHSTHVTISVVPNRFFILLHRARVHPPLWGPNVFPRVTQQRGEVACVVRTDANDFSRVRTAASRDAKKMISAQGKQRPLVNHLRRQFEESV